MNRTDRITLAVATCAALLAGTTTAKTLEIPLPGPAAFTTTIDNAYLPLPAGASFAYRAETDDGCEYNKVFVTPDTKSVTIQGQTYTTLIIRDQAWEDEDCDFQDVVLVEDTEDYHAQNTATQNVWYFGEKSWAVDDESDQCSDDGSWEGGLPVGDPEVDPAQPGIVMLGSPEPGDRYRQELLEDVAEDWGAVLRLNARVSIDAGDFDGCLMTREWSPLEPGQIEHKFYCPEPGNPGPGLVFVDELKGRNVRAEYVGSDFGTALPGEYPSAFPSNSLDCELP